MVSLYKLKQVNGRHISEHRLVVENFIKRELGRNEYVHHINGNKLDNRIENLQILSPLEHNRLHFEKLPKIKICKVCGKEFEPPTKHRGRNTICSKECWSIWQKKCSQFRNIQIKQYDKDMNFVQTFNSIKDASASVNGLSTNIVKCLKGKIKSAYGFKWVYGNI